MTTARSPFTHIKSLQPAISRLRLDSKGAIVDSAAEFSFVQDGEASEGNFKSYYPYKCLKNSVDTGVLVAALTPKVLRMTTQIPAVLDNLLEKKLGFDTPFLNIPFWYDNTGKTLSCKAGADLMRFLNKKVLTNNQRVFIILQLFLAVKTLHDKFLVHRDLKPANFLVFDLGADHPDPDTRYYIELADLDEVMQVDRQGKGVGLVLADDDEIPGTRLFQAGEFVPPMTGHYLEYDLRAADCYSLGRVIDICFERALPTTVLKITEDLTKANYDRVEQSERLSLDGAIARIKSYLRNELRNDHVEEQLAQLRQLKRNLCQTVKHIQRATTSCEYPVDGFGVSDLLTETAIARFTVSQKRNRLAALLNELDTVLKHDCSCYWRSKELVSEFIAHQHSIPDAELDLAVNFTQHLLIKSKHLAPPKNDPFPVLLNRVIESPERRWKTVAKSIALCFFGFALIAGAIALSISTAGLATPVLPGLSILGHQLVVAGLATVGVIGVSVGIHYGWTRLYGARARGLGMEINCAARLFATQERDAQKRFTAGEEQSDDLHSQYEPLSATNGQ